MKQNNTFSGDATGSNVLPAKNTANSKFGVTSSDDYFWNSKQIPCVQTLWSICWGSDPFGDRWVEIDVSLPESTFRKARKVLKDAGMFDFKADKNSSDNRKTSKWLTRNLKGAKAHLYKNSEKTIAHELATNAHYLADNAHYLAGNLPESLGTASFQNLSLQDPVHNSIPVDHVVDQILIPDQNKNQDQVILKPCVSAQARESVCGDGDEATLNASPPETLGRAKALSQESELSLSVGAQPTLDATVAHEIVEVGIEHNHLISDTQKAQEGTLNPLDDSLIIEEKTTTLEPRFAQFYSERALELMNNPVDPVLLREPFSPLVNQKQAKIFGKHLRRLAEASISRKLDKREIRAALTQDWALLKDHENADRLLELLRIYIRYNFQEITENIYISTLYKHAA